MKQFTEVIGRGVEFIRNNPQMMFTIALLILIPVAFFFTSEQFLSLARQNQDRLERGRVGVLQDAVAEFARDHVSDPTYLNEKISLIAEKNPTLSSFRVLTASSSQYIVLASAIPEERGVEVSLDQYTNELTRLATVRTDQSFSTQIYLEGERYWRTARAVTDATGTTIAILLSDVSMAQGDQQMNKEIRNAYITLIVVVFVILLVLARQAKIIDYAALYQRLREVDQMKDNFVSMAAHELRSPLSVIRGYVEMLRDEQAISDAGKENLRRIDVSANNLNTLVGDILDVAKLQEGRMSFQFESLDIAPITKDVVDSFARPASEKGLSLVNAFAPTPMISIDVTRFRQVLVNLVGNAIKYTPKGEVRVATREVSGILEIRVSDTGIGISAEDQKQLFQKFYRVKTSDTQKIAGTGLGLWITKEIVRQMKGQISVESIEGKGSDFILRFPVVQ